MKPEDDPLSYRDQCSRFLLYHGNRPAAALLDAIPRDVKMDRYGDGGVVAELEAEGVKWGREILAHSPLAIRSLKSAFNADLDGQAGIQELAGNATLLYYMSEEAKEFHGAQRQKRKPNSRNFPWLP